ncbi:hypothetical protein LTR17_025944 [Elasticomyces elasticus]|nr:hypothetical protein LTR17_025944 [Elasticomyces elasticus]
MGLIRKKVTFDLPTAGSSEMAVDPPLKSAMKKPATMPSKVVALKAVNPAKRKSSSSQQGNYEVKNTKRTEYYSDGRKVTVYKKTYSYWP